MDPLFPGCVVTSQEKLLSPVESDSPGREAFGLIRRTENKEALNSGQTAAESLRLSDFPPASLGLNLLLGKAKNSPAKQAFLLGSGLSQEDGEGAFSWPAFLDVRFGEAVAF